jgi:hypothetical protein
MQLRRPGFGRPQHRHLTAQASELLGHDARGGEALVGVFSHRAREPGIKTLGNGCLARWQRCCARTDLKREAHQGSPLKRPVSGHALESDDTQAPEVRAVIDGDRAPKVFRAHVDRRTEHLARERAGRGPLGRGQPLGDAEVEHLEDLLVIVAYDQDVVRLQVAMDQPGVVRPPEGTPDLRNDLSHHFRAQALDAREALRECLPFEQLHDHERSTGRLIDSIVEHLHDVNAAQPCHQAGFTLEAA